MEKPTKKKKFLPTAYFKGGATAMSLFVQQQLKYPKEAFEQRIEGSVHVKYEIDYKGVVVKAKVVSGIGFGCDEEAVRVVQLLRFEVSKNRDLKFKFDRDIHIHFKLPVQNAQTNLKYTITVHEKEEDQSKPVYSYKIII